MKPQSTTTPSRRRRRARLLWFAAGVCVALAGTMLVRSLTAPDPMHAHIARSQGSEVRVVDSILTIQKRVAEGGGVAPQDIESLRERLDSADPFVRELAYETLFDISRQGHPSARELLAQAHQDPHAAVRQRVPVWYWRAEVPGWQTVTSELLQDPDPTVREAAARQLHLVHLSASRESPR